MFGACSTQHIATLTAPLKNIQAPEKNVAVKDAGKKKDNCDSSISGVHILVVTSFVICVVSLRKIDQSSQ